jgi:ABC-type multidrug transport system ATPase subunit
MADLSKLSLNLQAVTKRYSRSPVFSAVTFEAHQGEIIAITGANGSGKSTLLKIIAGVSEPTKGKCNWKIDQTNLANHENVRGREISNIPQEIQKILGFVSPYLELYNELTAIEHVQFVAELKRLKISSDEAVNELTSFGLDKDIASSDRTMKHYSSGMQQRVRLAMAFISKPKILLLDEPSSNLDEAGIQTLFRKLDRYATDGSIVIIATNDEREKNLASREVALEPFKR